MKNFNVINENGNIVLDSTIMIKGQLCSAGSKMLESYQAPFSASLVEKLEENYYSIYGQGQPREFSLEEGLNGSVDCVAEGKVDIGIGTDTGANLVRASLAAGIPAYVPSPSYVSSYGLITASSMTRPAIFGDFDEIIKAADIILGPDSRDPLATKVEINLEILDKNLLSYKVGIYGEVDELVLDQLDKLTDLKFIYKDHLPSLFDIFKSVEVASGTAKFDGIRYGYRTDDYDNLDDYYAKTRSEGFSYETKKAIVKGNLYAGAAYERELYGQAIKLRNLLTESLNEAFSQVDLIIGRATTSLGAFAALTGRPFVGVGNILILADINKDAQALSFGKELMEVL